MYIKYFKNGEFNMGAKFVPVPGPIITHLEILPPTNL